MPDETAREAWVEDVLEFWFGELTPEQWYRKDDATDTAIRDRFGALYEKLSRQPPGADAAEAALAAVIVLDQFPRNMFRGSAKAFATDAMALAIAGATIGEGLDGGLSAAQRQFLYMPYQHSEDAAVQARSVGLFTRLGDAELLDYAERHKAVIDRFGRFPHRNEILGRASTREELEFLKQPGSSF